MKRILHIALLSLTVAACQTDEKSLAVSGNAVQKAAPHKCGQGEFVLTKAGKIRCEQNSNSRTEEP